MAMGFGVDETLGRWRVLSDHLALSTVGSITPDLCLLPVQQCRQHLAIMDIRGRGSHGVRQLRPTVAANRAFMPKCHRFPFLV